MGMITVTLDGSFGARRNMTFSAMKEGHAAAIGEAIRYLAEKELPAAIQNDHRCHNEQVEPETGFAGMGKICS